VNNRYSISKEKTSFLKGFFAVVIVCAHCRNNMPVLNNTVVGMALTASGYLSVGFFFFLSGYGVETQYMRLGRDYLSKYPYDRLLRVFFIAAVTVVIYGIIDSLFYEGVSTVDFLWSFFYGRTILAYGWYLQAALLMYLLFYLSKKLLKESKQWIGLIFGGLIYVCFSVLLCQKPLLYCSAALSFPTGVFYARKQNIIVLKRNSEYMALGGIFLLFCITVLIGNIPIGSRPLWVMCKVCSSVLFDLWIVFVAVRLHVSGSILKRLGEISLEIYLVQEIPIRLLRSEHIYILNDWVYLLTALSTTIVLSIIVHRMIGCVTKGVRTIHNSNT